jgi:UDP-sugar transporter A1/2/3
VKWFSLFLLTAGVAIVQLEGVTTSSSSSSSHGGGTSRVEDQVVGLAAILAACITSGLAGGYFEYVLKSASTTAVSSTSRSDVKKVTVTTPPTLWTRNLQLSIPSLSFSLLFLLLSSPSPSTTPLAQLSNIFDGFSPLVWSVVLNQAVGGLLVAMVIREADGVAKGFATSIAIIGTLAFAQSCILDGPN